MSRSKWFDKMTPDLTKSGQGRIQADAHRNIEERLEAVEDGVESISVPATPSSIGAASLTEPYVTISASSGLSAERVLTGTSNQITVTDGGANSTVTLSTPQNLHTAATFQVERLGIGGASGTARSLALFDADGSAALTMVAAAVSTSYTLVWPDTIGLIANGVLNTDSSGNMSWYNRSFLASSTETYVTTASTSGLANERVLTGTANQIVVTDNGAGSTVVLSTPQNLDTAASFRVGRLGINGAAGAARSLAIFDSDGSDAVTITANATTTGYALELPAAQGPGNYAMTNNGSGVLSWAHMANPDANETITGSWNFTTAIGFSVSGAPSIETLAATWLQWVSDYSAEDPVLMRFQDNFSSNQLDLMTSSYGSIQLSANRAQRWQDASGSILVAGNGADPPASTFMGKVDRIAQVANIATTNLSDAHGTGMYAVDAVLECTTNAGAAGTLALTIGWTDDVGATTSTPIAAFSLAVTGRTTGRQVMYSTNGTITYAIAVTGIYSTAAYALRIRITYLG